MKLATLAVLALTLLPASPALARHHDNCDSFSLGSFRDSHTHWTDRRDTGRARIAIDTRDGGVSLLLADDALVLQLSDKTMRKVRRELREERYDDEDNVFAQAIKSAVLDVVGSMLDHGLACRIQDVRSVDYRDGRLEIVNRDGEPMFESVEVENDDLLASFSERDARNFVAEFERAKRRAR